MVATLESRWQETRAFAEPAEALFRDGCTGVTWELDTARIFSAWSLMYLGELAELRRRWAGLMKEARDRGDRYLAGTLGTLPMAVLRLADDDPAAAEEGLRQASGLWSREGFHVQHHNRVLAECYINLYRGEGREARGRLASLWPAYARSLLLRLQVIRIELRRLRAMSALAAAAAAHGRGPFLREAAREARRLDRERAPGGRAHASLIRAQVAALTGDPRGSRASFDAAIGAFESLGMSLPAAAARRRLGTLLGGHEGSALVAEADDWMTSQGIRDPARMAALYVTPDPPRGPRA
jgi:hypothetical protein